MNKPTTDNERDACQRASANLLAIETLLAMPEFTRFMERFKERSEALAFDILHDDDIKPERREALRNLRKGIMEVCNEPRYMIRSSRMILKKHGLA